MRTGRADIGVGDIATPLSMALYMVNKLFEKRAPDSSSRVLDAGCGTGRFIEAVLLWCRQRGIQPPEIVGIEINARLAEQVSRRFGRVANVRIVRGDFLTIDEKELGGKFDYVISNPPYISYDKIDDSVRSFYKRLFRTAVGRFDIYMLFFEKALNMLKPGGRMVFITPEKYLYVVSARNLRRLLARYHVEEVELLSEDVFEGVLAYPVITVVSKCSPARTLFRLRDNQVVEFQLPADGSPWLAEALMRCRGSAYGHTLSRRRLEDIAIRISAGVATGRDNVFVLPKMAVPDDLRAYAHPTISGGELAEFRPGEEIDYDRLRYVMLVPYDREGRLLSVEEAAPLIDYLSRWRRELESRYVVRKGKRPWYAFHEHPPLKDLLRPKILWRDIAREPAFYVDPLGLIIPRHSVYYLVPKNPAVIPKLVDYLNSDEVKSWLKARCQRAANGYLRLQSHVLKTLSIPDELFKEGCAHGNGGLIRWGRWARTS